jgi:class 3 adenylate cyclase/tetratricopeptide (TPR) repeat protein
VPKSVELATVLLSDLVGSTRLATSVGPARADELRDEFFALLREAIEASGGTEVKNLGDGLMVAFSSASAAVQCAVLTQQLFERRYRHAEQKLHVRIGLGTGESTVQDGDYFGMPTVEAARLCDKAPTDGILASAATRLMAGRCEGVEFESAGAMVLKGIPDPVEVFALTWRPLENESAATRGADRWPLPSVLRSVPTVAYVGRVPERTLVDVARARVRTGERRVLLLSGEPGIGKTRLAAFSAHGAHAEGFCVAWGSCSEELSVAYEPWIAVCEQLVANAPDELLAAHVDRSGGELSRLGRGLGRRVPGLPAPQTSDPETERFLLFSAVTGLLREVCAVVPLYLVLDDFHWADAQSVALMKHLARTVDRGALLVIVTYRDSDLTRDHPLTGALADLRRIDGVERLRLDGLGAGEVAEVMSAAAGHALDSRGVALAGEIAAETGGNPFFVSEILRHLRESGALAFDEETGRWRLDGSKAGGLPESVRDVIDRRVERLGDQAREVLTGGAVIGRSFDLELLARLVDVSESRLLDLLDTAVSASVLIESADRAGRFSFAHALINEALYVALGATRRARMHERVAIALEELCGEDPGERVGELARHWAAATQPAQADKAIEYARRAGMQALERLVPDEAVKWFGQALQLVEAQRDPDPALRCELLIDLGNASREAGGSFRRILLEASRLALENGDIDRLTRAVLANNRGRISSYGSADEQRIELLEAAVDRMAQDQPVIRARVLSLLALELTFDAGFERRRALSDSALELARTGGDDRALGQVLRDRLYTIWAPGTVEERRANVAELLELSERLDDPVLRFWARMGDMDVRSESGDFEGARKALGLCQAIAEQVGHPTLRWSAATQAACLATLSGSPHEVGSSAQLVLALGRGSSQPDALRVAEVVGFFQHWFEARWDEALAIAEPAVQRSALQSFHSSLGVCYLEAGRLDDARKILDEAVERDPARMHRDVFTTSNLAMYAMVATALHNEAAAAVLSEQLAVQTGPVVWNGIITMGALDVYRGMLAGALGRHEEADALLAAGVELNDRIGAIVWAIRARLQWATLLAERGGPGDAERAAQLFTQARAGAETLGTPALLERAEAGIAHVTTA